jgi:hypothetical protein
MGVALLVTGYWMAQHVHDSIHSMPAGLGERSGALGHRPGSLVRRHVVTCESHPSRSPSRCPSSSPLCPLPMLLRPRGSRSSSAPNPVNLGDTPSFPAQLSNQIKRRLGASCVIGLGTSLNLPPTPLPPAAPVCWNLEITITSKRRRARCILYQYCMPSLSGSSDPLRAAISNTYTCHL